MTETERLLLALAGRRYRYGAALADDVHRQTGLSLGRFWQAVYALIDRPDVEAAEPALVHRLRRLRDRRQAARRAA
ncbi:hypothetical protein LUZ63_020067 [Rhynchospora breviuscula]|uniref:DUF3263 domain-containing protein n=1 Tax=Rhynchospora breviuscula TaxID=2022672 RepID=A0A9P9Z9E2_9POAL|nr:hypothetical protein LUZ63_020067 [Rhynchospora breviuscula]